MRYHKAGRTLDLLMDSAIPRRSDGALAICTDCQRSVWFEGGYLAMLAQRLDSMAKASLQLQRTFIPALHKLEIGQSCGAVTRQRESAVQMAKDVADELCWTITIQRPGTDSLRIVRQA